MFQYLFEPRLSRSLPNMSTLTRTALTKTTSKSTQQKTCSTYQPRYLRLPQVPTIEDLNQANIHLPIHPSPPKHHLPPLRRHPSSSFESFPPYHRQVHSISPFPIYTLSRTNKSKRRTEIKIDRGDKPYTYYQLRPNPTILKTTPENTTHKMPHITTPQTTTTTGSASSSSSSTNPQTQTQTESWTASDAAQASRAGAFLTAWPSDEVYSAPAPVDGQGGGRAGGGEE
ncbi:hypothetical protein F4810DRAFT_615259 [Camillea tinctor]|nr:hypothetical protein F4810DRAFT_615259 [Camillea tinctor]